MTKIPHKSVTCRLSMAFFSAVLLGGWLGGWATTASASEAHLRAFLADANTMRASFIQRVEDEGGFTLELSSGTFYLSRPGKFRWNYRGDDAISGSKALGQQIVADGHDLYFYDPDLEQVSQRSLADALSQVPSLLLVKSGAELDEHFVIADLGLTDGLSWVALKPQADDAGYQQLLLGFDGPLITSLVLYDGLGNTTRLAFNEVSLNPALDAELFVFTVPDGADLMSE